MHSLPQTLPALDLSAFVVRGVQPAEPEYRPSPDPEPEPSPLEQAEALGYDLAMMGEHVEAPEPWPFPMAAAFIKGWLRGRDAYREDGVEYHAWLDDRYRERMEEIMAQPEDLGPESCGHC